MTVLTNKRFSLPGELDERRLCKHDNARAAAKTFAVQMREKEKRRRKRALFTDKFSRSDHDSNDEEETAFELKGNPGKVRKVINVWGPVPQFPY